MIKGRLMRTNSIVMFLDPVRNYCFTTRRDVFDDALDRLLTFAQIKLANKCTVQHVYCECTYVSSGTKAFC